ncbi:endonuclease/exonuclease/phosphatase family protein [Vibrio bivalvicida]|uniref:Hydrolase n=1 Tax=Vibrio bivalvicida TaxID=1276888 RepID=A0A177Y4R1_9VIBR|nr:endonuclease/exonuclease/phosphatase family protein [Vibrio bivalvicida]OAJ95853.1 hydrolase [Vibrio bivalvicida]
MLPPKSWSLFVSLLCLLSFYSSANDSVYATWNIEWLSNTPSEKFSSSQRNEDDYFALSRHFASIAPQVLAFQEVNDPIALKRVIGSDYQLFFSQRSLPTNKKHQFDEINQYTGFAVKKGINVFNREDIHLDSSSNSKLRFATYIVLNPNSSNPIHALSVHLKARCSGAYRNSRDCKTLKQQGKTLNHWIKERESSGESYVILGDFNHNLSYQGDWLWKEMTQGTSAHLASKQTKAECKVKSRNNPKRTHQFRSLIDHIVVSEALATTKPEQIVFPVPDVLEYTLSDHCPLSMQIH